MDFTRPLEGHIDHMYVDTLGLVTTSDGNLIDPYYLAAPLAIPSDRIYAEWTKLEHDSSLPDGGAKAAARVTTLFLAPDAIAALIARLAANEARMGREVRHVAGPTGPHLGPGYFKMGHNLLRNQIDRGQG